MRPPALLLALALVAAAVAGATLGAAASSPGVPGATATTDGFPDDPDGNVTVLRGPPALGEDLGDAAAVRAARARDRLVAGDAVPGDTLVAVFRSPRLNRTVERVDGPNATARFFRAANATNATVRAVERYPPPEQLRLAVPFRESDVRVVRDRANATFLLVVDTANLTTTTTDGEPLPDREVRPGTELVVRVTVPGDGENRTLAGTVRFVALDGELAPGTDGVTRGEPLTATAGEPVRLAVATTLVPGENATLRLRDADGTVVDGAVAAAVPRPDADGTLLNATLSPAAVNASEQFVVEAGARNRTLLRERGVVGEPPTLSNLSAVETANGSVRVAATVRYPDDGFLRVWDGTDDEWLDDVRVPAGERTRAAVAVAPDRLGPGDEVHAVGWWDADGDGSLDDDPGRVRTDRRWRTGGGVVEATERVEPATPTATASPRRTTASPSPTRDGTATPTDTVGQSGFGLVALALAVALAIALAGRQGATGS